MRSGRLIWVNAILLVTFLGSHWGAAVEEESDHAVDFLRSIQPQFRHWKHSDSLLSSVEMNILQPDSVILRRFQSPNGQMVDFAVIAGNRKKSVHTPGYCMPGSGWETLSQGPVTLPLKDRTVEATQALMTDTKGVYLLVTYFFTDGETTTPGIIRFQIGQFLKRLKRQNPAGALVRIWVPFRADPGPAAKLTEEFCAQNLPPVLDRLRAFRRGDFLFSPPENRTALRGHTGDSASDSAPVSTAP